MAPPKEKIFRKEKEERETSKYLRRRLAWCNQTGQQYDKSEDQYSLLPRALAEPDGGLLRANGQTSSSLATMYLEHTIPVISTLSTSGSNCGCYVYHQCSSFKAA